MKMLLLILIFIFSGESKKNVNISKDELKKNTVNNKQKSPRLESLVTTINGTIFDYDKYSSSEECSYNLSRTIYFNFMENSKIWNIDLVCDSEVKLTISLELQYHQNGHIYLSGQLELWEKPENWKQTTLKYFHNSIDLDSNYTSEEKLEGKYKNWATIKIKIHK